ncbi:MAG: penicillin-binding protein 2, penicillin-binding protein 2 [Candidatus Kaiserbacteria bacterium]|nr:penicillin-binding protein 2, penicillin-binding protein 2 [Candidatus Kaiserbacteria bacterium]
MRWKRKRRIYEIAPEEIFLDSSNLPEYDSRQFEGRVERPVATRSIFTVGVVFTLVVCLFGYRAFNLQVAHGDTYASISNNNTLKHSLVFATRGLMYDRTGRELAWNEAQIATGTATSTATFALRKYSAFPGLAHLIGFIQYPRSDAKGSWWREEYSGVSGLELSLNDRLSGQNGSTMVETDAHNHLERSDIVSPPVGGEDITLSIDADVQSKLFTLLSQHARDMHFVGGAAVIMNVETGEILAMTSFPEYDHQAFTDGNSAVVRAASLNTDSPLLNRAVAGAYTPGSIVKPIFAAAALNEGIISPDKQIISVGQISLPNPYDPSNPSIFRDWTVHGAIDMRTALAVSSDEYFYTIGGGYGGQKGLGIQKLDEYAQKFGLGKPTGISLIGEVAGVIPTPQWKAQAFGPNDPWRIGDTYHTAIGQYGFQVTPIQAVRYVAAIANGGKLLTPQLIASSTPQSVSVGIPDTDLEIVREGMRMAVTSTRSDATVKFFNIAGIQLAAKTGTAQLGYRNESMNSWSIGFWPADHPKYAYAVVLEKAPAGTASGAAPGMLPFFQWLIANHPEYTH